MSVLDETKSKMQKAIEHLKDSYKTLRTSRLNPNMLDDIKIEAYGSMAPLKSLATLSVKERQLIVTPFDISIIAQITKAILQSPFNLNPIQEKTSIRVPIPPLDEALRKKIAKEASQKTEEAKVVLREIRRKSNELIRQQQSDGEITKDELKSHEKKIQDLTDQFCTQSDKLLKDKEIEIMTV